MTGLNPDHLQAFTQRWAADQAATVHAATVVVGDRLGLFRALADHGPVSAADLAEVTGCQPRLVREWLHAQAASAYCEHDASAGTFWLTPEQAACLADDASPTFVAAGAVVTSSAHKDIERVVEAFRGDGGIGWGDHHDDLFTGTERFFQPVYRANLVSRWIPALDGVEAKLRAGARVADVGCGLGVPLRLLAEAYPASSFAGFDYHEPSVDAARAEAAAAGVADRVTFSVAGAESFDGGPYDLVCVFNALHEWGDPVAASRHIRTSLAAGGTFMFTEPDTDPALEATTRARTFFSVSTVVCTPSALSQGAGDRALGAQAGEAALRDVLTQAGFSSVRRATQTPNFMVLEARP